MLIWAVTYDALCNNPRGRLEVGEIGEGLDRYQAIVTSSKLKIKLMRKRSAKFNPSVHSQGRHQFTNNMQYNIRTALFNREEEYWWINTYVTLVIP